MFLALLIGLNAVGIDLTAFTVFSGAIGVGLGFGLQKIVSNFVSGIILLAERSIKPGDVIEVGGTLRFRDLARRALYHVARPRRQGIPDPERDADHEPGGQLVLYQPVCPPRHAVRRRLRQRSAAGAAARDRGGEARRKRVQSSPEPVCHVTEFGDNGINLLLRFWIADPANGVINIKGDVFLALWDRFVAHGIELPFPQRDLRIRDLPPGVLRRADPDETLGGGLSATQPGFGIDFGLRIVPNLSIILMTFGKKH